MSAYTWDLGIKVPVKSQKCSDNSQNMLIIVAVLRYKIGEIMLVLKLW